MKKNIKPELLAPAGDLKKLKYAFEYGADAVYCGLPIFSLRAKTGFNLKTLIEGIEYTKLNKKKIYITINIFPKNEDLPKIEKHLKNLKECPPDALIISDPGVLKIVKKILPKIHIFLSTQANTLNHQAVSFWKDLGIKRIILGREVNLDDIKKIHKLVKKVDLEIFVHGAMCMSYSGRCYLSSWLTGRSANKGLCTQPCRWNYNLYLEEPLRPGMLIPITEDKKGTYILNSKDLCLIDHLKELIDSGISSFKLEGRTKSIYYLAVATKAYRQAIDLIFSNRPEKEKVIIIYKIKKELEKVENRGYETGFMFEKNHDKLMNFKTSKPKNKWEFKGEILQVKDSRIYARVHNILENGSSIEIITPKSIYQIKVRDLKNNKGEKIKEAKGDASKIFNFEVENLEKYKIEPKSLMRKKKSTNSLQNSVLEKTLR